MIEVSIAVVVATLIAFKLNRQPIYQVDQTAETIRLISSLVTIYLFAIIAYVDLKIGLIPDHLIYPAMIFAAVAIPEHDLAKQVMNAAILAASLKFIRDTIYIFTKERLIGGGDIKLAIVLGLMLTPTNLGYTAAGAAVIAILISISKKGSPTDFMRYGPLVAAPALILSIFPT
jgi:prepilin signal peptidase PulO-like enzyme (type II secretory pathway)